MNYANNYKWVLFDSHFLRPLFRSCWSCRATVAFDFVNVPEPPPISIYSFLSPIVWFIYRLPLFSHSLSLERRRMKSEKGEKSNLHSNDGPRALSFPLLLFPKWRTCASYWLRQAAGADRRHNTHYSFFFFFSLPNLDELHTEELKIQSEFEPGFSLERNLGNKNKSVCLLVLNFIKRRTIPAVQSLISFCSVVCTALY